ncbi:hypothetical protein KP509_35G024400 [Ceratopteris richardii]|uniref:BFN domain-containing protein n=1 Tax=Ceratopteris richardii TaxID=49495 RepID=A0A8T2QFV4_CERRI|nr:hypothetical protein KP509_35G024400 [Ceratopteris richardii]
METLACPSVFPMNSCSIKANSRQMSAPLIPVASHLPVHKFGVPRGRNCIRPRLSIKRISCSNDMHFNATEHHQQKDDYINSTVIEAVEVKSGSDGFFIKMRDGQHIRCVQNNPDGGRLPEYAPQPVIVLKMEDGSNLLLPIIVLELPAAMLMETIRNVHLARPTVYQVLQDLIAVMGYRVKLVRITKRVQEAYYAQLILCKDLVDEAQEVILDLRPSDAINVAARCQAPIQVNRDLAYGDGVRMINDPIKVHMHTSSSGVQRAPPRASVVTELDRPQTDQASSLEAEEFVLVRSMFMAAAEERYTDAARIRDELKDLRAKGNN